MSAEQKFARERYILVAAMVNAIIAGVWNIYVAEDTSNQWSTLKTRTYDIQGSYYVQPNKSNKQLLSMRWRERRRTI